MLLTHLDTEIKSPALSTIDLQTWLPCIVGLFKERICSQQQQLYILTTAEIPQLTTDICALEQILTELLTNACKYTPAGKAIVVCAYATQNAIQISVSNSGVEISTEQQTRIFAPFYRIPNNDPWQMGGSGLGLALVQKLAQQLGALIQVESIAGQTTFTVVFPQTNKVSHSKNSERIRFLTC
jgi:signal transduction histidine kinase